MQILKNFIISFNFLIFLFFLLFLLIEYTKLFERIYFPDNYDDRAKKAYLLQGFSEEYYEDIKKESGSVNQTNYEDYFYVTPQIIEQEYVNITDYYNSRKVKFISKINESKLKIWMFGGSTMLELGVEDQYTIASSLAKNFKQNNQKVFIANFGMNGFNTTLERIKFLELLHKVEPEEIPNEVIFYHGLNDVTYSHLYNSPYVMPHYMSKGLKIIVNQDHKGLIFYGLERYFWKSAAVLSGFKKYLENIFLENTFLEDTKVENTPVSNLSVFNRAVKYYLNNEKMINSICLEYKIKCHFILQPSLVTKKNPTEAEATLTSGLGEDFIDWHLKFYDLVKNSSKNYLFYDLTYAFDESEESIDYSDWIHLAPLSSQYIGNKIYNAVYK